MRTINLIVIHCSATKVTRNFTVADLEACHKSQGWSGIGYHYYITKDGQLHQTRPEDVPGIHAKRYNAHSIGICYEGGLDANGQTDDNLLHQRHRRNPYLIAIMSDLGLMEGEGSGYDLIYELNSMEGKHPPIPESSFNEFKVTQYSEIQNTDILPLLDYTLKNYELTQKGYITFGAIANETKMLATKLSAYLQLSNEERLRSYIGPIA